MGVKGLSAALAGFVLLGVVVGQGQDEGIVDIPTLGQIKGYPAVTSYDQTDYFIFHGIPYADPASYTGVNRFKPSKVWNKPLTSDGTAFQANKFFVICPQDEIFDLDGIIPRNPLDEDAAKNETLKAMLQDLPTIYRKQHQKKRARAEKLRSVATTQERLELLRRENDSHMGVEECLTININTPILPTDINDPTQLLPVVVFYHGGGSDSVWGSAFTALRMLEHKVVLVSMNYRLGVLGALNLDNLDAPGCAGLYDSVTVLRWIKQNIMYFGGNPDLVTISGQSAGSMMVTNLLISPITKTDDLFHRVWGFSGSAVSVWAVAEAPSINKHLQIAEIAGCYNPAAPVTNEQVAACMRDATLDTLVQALAVWKHNEEYQGRLGYDARMPSIQATGLKALDPTFEYFMEKHPYETLGELDVRAVPVVLGATRHDGSYPLDDIYNNFIKPHGHDQNPEYLKNEMLPYLLRVLGIRDDTGELYHAMARDYFGNSSTTGTWEDKLPGMLDMVTTMAFKAGSYDILRHMNKLGEVEGNIQAKNAYFYSLDYVGRWSLYNFLWGDMYIPGGICHTDDLIYFFWLGPLLNDDMRVSRRWMDYFINFAYHGDVNGDPADPDYKDFWKPYDPVHHYYMKFDRVDKIVEQAPDYFLGAAAELFVDWNPNPSEPTTHNWTASYWEFLRANSYY